MSMMNLTTFLISTLIAIGAIAAGLATAYLITHLLRHYHSQRPIRVGEMPIRVDCWFGPVRAIIPAIFLRFVIPLLDYPTNLSPVLRHALHLWIIGSIAWLIVRTLG